MRRSLLVPLFVLACAPAASARVVVVAGGNRAATLVDVSTNAVAARVTLPGRTRTVAVAPDGSRAWFGVGSRVIAVDLASRAAALPIAVRGRISALTMSADGERLYAARRGAIDAIDTTTGAVAGAIRTGAAPIRALAASPDGTRLAALAGTRLLQANVQQARVVRARHLTNANAIAFSPGGTLWALAAGRLVAVNRSARIHLRRGYAGGLAISADGRRAYVGAARGHSRTAVIDLTRGRVRARIPTGRGPGFPTVAPDGVRVYVGNGGEDDNDILHGVSATTSYGRGGDDVLLGNEGDDRLEGERGHDTVLGEDGNDVLYGGLDDDSVDGGPGDDRLNTVGGGFDTITCGPGIDRIYADATDRIATDCEDVHI